jgi:hypothetical protein
MNVHIYILYAYINIYLHALIPRGVPYTGEDGKDEMSNAK